MLVYFVNHSTAPINLGGAERSMITFVEDWMSADPELEPFFLTKAPRGRFIEAIEQKGWPYLALRYRGWALPPTKERLSQVTYFARDDYQATLRMAEAMTARRPDLVVTNTLVAPWGAFAAKALGIPHAWFIREYGDLDHGLVFQLGREKTLQDIGTLSEAVFVNSVALRDHVAPFIDAEKLSVVYPRVDTSRIAALSLEKPATEPFVLPAPTLKIAIVGRLSASKGQQDAIRAIALLSSRGVQAELCLVGASEPPDYERVLKNEARRLAVFDRVRFAGEQANPFPYVAEADVCVTASGIEAFGRTTLEYLASGKPVVASSSGGSAELVLDGVTGILYQPGDTEALASALERYARDPALVTTHGRAAANRAGELGSTGFDNATAIAKLTAITSGPSYRLPNAAGYWFALPGMFFAAQNSGSRITVAFALTRAGRALRRSVRAGVRAVHDAARRRSRR